MSETDILYRMILEFRRKLEASAAQRACRWNKYQRETKAQQARTSVPVSADPGPMGLA